MAGCAEDDDVLRGNTSRRAKLGHSVNVKDLPKEKGLDKWIVQKDPSYIESICAYRYSLAGFRFWFIFEFQTNYANKLGSLCCTRTVQTWLLVL